MAIRQRFLRQINKIGGRTELDKSGRYPVVYAYAPDGQVWKASGTHGICQSYAPLTREEAYESLIDDLRLGTVPGPCVDDDCDLCYGD